MRLVKNRSQLIAHFTLRWELAYLAELPPQWVSFSLVGETEPLGTIHSRTHEVRLREGCTIADRQVVVLNDPGMQEKNMGK